MNRSTLDPSECDAAVLYLRVSSKRQMNTAIDLDPDGLSIHTQREHGAAKADSLNAIVAEEFVEPGKSAKDIIERDVFQQMIAYLHSHPEVKYVIVYMRSRAFRNQFDAAIVQVQLQKIGVRLVSVKEDFGQGPYAQAMEGMLDIMNGLQNTLQGLDIADKMLQKAINGGTNGYAKLGYLNTQTEIDGKLFNSIQLDPVRAPLVRTAWELYATGNYTVERLEAAMADRGLTSRARGKLPERPVEARQLHRMLADLYYTGFVVYKNQIYPGRHEPLIDQSLFDRVQAVRNIRSHPGQRDRILTHYLKGTLFCQRCRTNGRTARLIYTEATSHTRRRYGYFMCRGRQDGLCDLPHLPAHLVEQAVIDNYATLRLPTAFIRDVHRLLDTALADEHTSTRALHASLRQRLTELDAQEERLLDLAADAVLPQTKIKTRLRRIQAEREHTTAGLQTSSTELAAGANYLRNALELLTNPHTLYSTAPDTIRRLINQTLYHAIHLDDRADIVVTHTLTPPFDDFHHASSLHTGPHTPPADHQTSGLSTIVRPNPPATTADHPSLTAIYTAPVTSAAQTTTAVIELMRVYCVETHLTANLDRLRKQLADRTERVPNLPPQPRALRRRFTGDQLAEIRAAYEDGWSTNQLAMKYQLGKGSVLRLLRASGATIRQERRLTDNEIDHAIARYRNGESLARIAADLGVAADTVSAGLERRGIPRRDTHGRPR
ncbi:recombinase family protein [Nocardia sp. CA-128927]|uniref:recombinase family protein n=1 Tax=Nocardia sp. CA-128927 TaxID=3239975 RepID=UPI003D9786C5